jgi:hypothetical protein
VTVTLTTVTVTPSTVTQASRDSSLDQGSQRTQPPSQPSAPGNHRKDREGRKIVHHARPSLRRPSCCPKPCGVASWLAMDDSREPGEPRPLVEVSTMPVTAARSGVVTRATSRAAASGRAGPGDPRGKDAAGRADLAHVVEGGPPRKRGEAAQPLTTTTTFGRSPRTWIVGVPAVSAAIGGRRSRHHRHRRPPRPMRSRSLLPRAASAEG